jgi:hypothetical protein
MPEPTGLSVRQMAKLLKKFHVSNGDIIALKHQSENANRAAMDFIATALEGMGIQALVVVVNDFDDLSVLNETEMAHRGWFKLQKFSKSMRITDRNADD